MKKIIDCLLFVCISSLNLQAQDNKNLLPREHLSMDTAWRFSFGHPFDAKRDFNNGTSYFSYFAKAGYGDGAAATLFDDRAWRKIDLPHDWAVALPFDKDASYSHGFKALGRKFPETSVGWYRKRFMIPASDLGRHISLAFDGVFRNSIVWVNGHYLGNEPSGYLGFEYDISDYLNYGGENVVAVRVDATMEEGWFYEGAGIYRHVWLNKTAPLHVATDGIFVSSAEKDGEKDVDQTGDAVVTAEANLTNEGILPCRFDLEQAVFDQTGKEVAIGRIRGVGLKPFASQELSIDLTVDRANRWSIEKPYRYKLVTTLYSGGIVIDRMETKFGIRSLRFDANEGFFMNGKRIEIKGTNNHQDHAGVGAAIPDALQFYRVRALKALGSNAYRCSHNPPAPELLDVCDSLGMLVIDENRLMGTTAMHLQNLKRTILRDRDHPCVIAWSIGNEEWQIENTEIGARIATTMQAYVKSLDSTRAVTAAFSGGWGHGISTVMDLIGFNYIAQEDPDGQHKKFPWQKGWGTEEGSTHATRGIYFPDSLLHLIPAYDKKPRPGAYSIEEGWNYYIKRPFLAGMFIWTGFDYRGEPTPYGWPSINSYFGMLDVCGFPKDDAWYLRSWWGDTMILHLFPHWNWKGKEGQPIDVWVYSNCDEVELFLNKKSMGKQLMQKNGHLEWKIMYEPGELEAVGYKNGRRSAVDLVKTTDVPHAVKMTADRELLHADEKDVSVITVQVNDKKDLEVPTADNLVTFTIEGPGRIIGVGNGDPASLEPDQVQEKIRTVVIEDLKKTKVLNAQGMDSLTPQKGVMYRGRFTLPALKEGSVYTFFYKSIGQRQDIYINGREIASDIPEDKKGNSFVLDRSILKEGINDILFLVVPLVKQRPWDVVNRDPGLIQVIGSKPVWQRKLFSGLAQVLIQTTGGKGDIRITAGSTGLEPALLILHAR